MLKRNWAPLLISGILFFVTFFHSNRYIESRIWTKWESLFIFCFLIYFLFLYKRKEKLKIDAFYLSVSSFSALLLIKTIIEDSYFYYSWYIICFWIMYSFFYFYNLSKYFLYNAFSLTALVLSVCGLIQYFDGSNFLVGTFDNPAGYSLSLVLLFPFIVYLWHLYSRNKQKWIYAIIGVMVILAVFLSGSRTALISIMLMIVYLVPQKFKCITYFLLLVLFFIFYKK